MTAVVAQLAGSEVDIVIATGLVGLAVRRATVGGQEIAVVADLATGDVENSIATAATLTVGAAGRVGIGTVVATVVAFFAQVRVDNTISTRGDDAIGLTPIAIGGIAVIAGFTGDWINDTVTADLARATVRGATITAEQIAVIAGFVGVENTVTATGGEANAGTTDSVRLAGIRTGRCLILVGAGVDLLGINAAAVGVVASAA
jgi:hypothetical protein